MIHKLTFLLTFWLAFLLVKLIHLILWMIPVNLFFGKKDSLLYLACWHTDSSGYHYRIQKWVNEFEQKKLRVKVLSVFENEAHAKELINHRQEKLLRYWMWKRLWQVLASARYEQVIVRRTLLLYNEYGDLFFERLLLAIHPSAILDIDDDMERQNPEKKLSAYGLLLLENRNKFRKSLNLYHRFIVGSVYLKSLVESQYKGRGLEIQVIPTCVDYTQLQPVSYGQIPEVIRLGWIGSDGNQHYLDDIIQALNALHKFHNIKLIVISGNKYRNAKSDFEIENLKWSIDGETELLRQFDLGIMPLRNSKMEMGKCGFKLIQYMGLGIVPVADAVGANSEIIVDGYNGFLTQEGNWEEVLLSIPKHWTQLDTMSKNAIKTVKERYSFEGNLDKYLQFLGKKVQ